MGQGHPQLTAGIGVVGTNDLGSRRVMAGLHSTHSLVTRSRSGTWRTIEAHHRWDKLSRISAVEY